MNNFEGDLLGQPRYIGHLLEFRTDTSTRYYNYALSAYIFNHKFLEEITPNLAKRDTCYGEMTKSFIKETYHTHSFDENSFHFSLRRSKASTLVNGKMK